MFETLCRTDLLNNFHGVSLIDKLILKPRSKGSCKCPKEEYARQGIQQKSRDWSISSIYHNNEVTIDSEVE